MDQTISTTDGRVVRLGPNSLPGQVASPPQRPASLLGLCPELLLMIVEVSSIPPRLIIVSGKPCPLTRFSRFPTAPTRRESGGSARRPAPDLQGAGQTVDAHNLPPSHHLVRQARAIRRGPPPGRNGQRLRVYKRNLVSVHQCQRKGLLLSHPPHA